MAKQGYRNKSTLRGSWRELLNEHFPRVTGPTEPVIFRFGRDFDDDGPHVPGVP
jgi:hypothetical protein